MEQHIVSSAYKDQYLPPIMVKALRELDTHALMCYIHIMAGDLEGEQTRREKAAAAGQSYERYCDSIAMLIQKGYLTQEMQIIPGRTQPLEILHVALTPVPVVSLPDTVPATKSKKPGRPKKEVQHTDKYYTWGKQPQVQVIELIDSLQEHKCPESEFKRHIRSAMIIAEEWTREEFLKQWTIIRLTLPNYYVNASDIVRRLRVTKKRTRPDGPTTTRPEESDILTAYTSRQTSASETNGSHSRPREQSMQSLWGDD